MMNARELRTLTRIMEFASNSDFERLEEYFHIPSTKSDGSLESRLSIWIEPTDSIDEYILVLRESQQSLCEKQGMAMEKVPEDVETLIYGYLKDSNTIRIRMSLPHPFPIRAPRFRLISATKDSGPMDRIIRQMNCDLSTDYSPALAVEKTLLILLSRILESVGWV